MQTDFEDAYTRSISPEQVAEMTLQAIEHKQLFVATHPEWRDLVQQRSDVIMEAFH
jgi:hypothetical protein